MSEPARVVAALFEAERPRLVGLCARLSGDWSAAEDLAQETLLDAWRHVDDLHDPGGVRPWLNAFARHRALRWRRAQRREQRVQRWPDDSGDLAEPDDGGSGAAALEEELERAERGLLLERALGHLPDATRALLVAHYHDEEQLVTLAARNGVSAGAIAVRLHRARQELRRVLATTLADEAAPYGLAPALPDVWQPTRIWCPFCGRQTLEATIDREGGWARFRCPCCRDGKPAQIANTPPAMALAGLQSPKAILSRQIRWLDNHYQQALAHRAAPCLRCGRQLSLAFGTPPGLLPPHVAPRHALSFRCDLCSLNDVQPLSYLALDHAATQRFWRRYPRMRLVPPRKIVYAGREALHTSFESADGSAQLSVVADAATFAVVLVDEGPVGGGAPALGWLMSAQAVGGLLGGVVVAQLGARLSPLRLFGPSAVLFGTIDLVIFVAPTLLPGLIVPLLLFILVGVPAVAMGSSMLTLLQAAADEAYRGRVFGSFGAMVALLTLLGLLLGGALGDRVGVVPVICLQGYLHVLVGVLAWPLLSGAAGSAPVGER